MGAARGGGGSAWCTKVLRTRHSFPAPGERLGVRGIQRGALRREPFRPVSFLALFQIRLLIAREVAMPSGPRTPILLPALGLCLFLAAGPAAAAPARPGTDSHPPYVPVTAGPLAAADKLVRSARWIRHQVWTEGTPGDASAYLFPRSFDVDSGYGILGTDYFSWMLEHDPEYRDWDRDHDTHRLDVPRDGSNDAAIERVMMGGGSNSYDMASWAMALAAAARNRHFTPAEADDFTQALAAYHHFLLTAHYPGGFASYRAVGDRPWQYGESGADPTSGADPQGRPYDARNAYYWAFPAPRWQNPDPHWDPLAPAGALMPWPGWDAVTGEQAWAAFLAPMQVACAQGRGRPGWAARRAPVDALALVDNAVRSLRAVALMQNSATGGVYRNVRGPDQPDDPKWFEVSLENNWSLYAGLGFLRTALLDLRAAPPDLRRSLAFDLDRALADLERIRSGMAGFFRNRALVWHAPGEPFGDQACVPYGFFLQGTGGRAGAARGHTDAFATDVQTWGVAAILADRNLERELAKVYGRDFLFEMLRAAVELGGYRRPGPDGRPVLAGIGFTSQAAGDPRAVLSGEWTWGAVNAAMVLADFYREPAQADPARVDRLLGWARAMVAGVDALASHDYNPDHRPGGREWVAYLYANARRWIPWGWHANACPSMAATTWAVRVSAGFDSFELGGGDHRTTVQALGLAGGQEEGTTSHPSGCRGCGSHGSNRGPRPEPGPPSLEG